MWLSKDVSWYVTVKMIKCVYLRTIGHGFQIRLGDPWVYFQLLGEAILRMKEKMRVSRAGEHHCWSIYDEGVFLFKAWFTAHQYAVSISKRLSMADTIFNRLAFTSGQVS